ncbi:voltage-gated delayed rectifier potassium channel KCNH8-like isoform X3 [Ptychodera flava]|uniref:voltage-gated delayed rectifier potassium channel KCNH8-like isoform X3 n=1 Tax=Ptychodera flava TaxID=63121 RepID=UPI003969BF96
MPARKGLLAPQNTFLDTIATRFDGTHSNFVLGNAQVANGYPIVYCSDGFCELTSFTRAEVMQKGCACKFLYGADTADDRKEEIENSLENKQELKTEVIFQKKNETPFWCLLDIVPIKNEKGEVVLFLASFKDITKSKVNSLEEDKSDVEFSDEEEEAIRQRYLQSRGGKTPNGSGTQFNYHRRRSRAVLYHLSGHLQKQERKKRKLNLSNNLLAPTKRTTLPEYKLATVKKPKLILLHYSTFKTVWDWLMLLAMFYVAIVVPYNVSFSTTKNPDSTSLYTDLIVEFLFIFDIILNFRTTYVSHSGQVVYKPKAIALHYVKSWFFIDLLAAIPLDLLYLTRVGTVRGQQGAGAMYLLKLVRLLRVARLLQKMERYSNYSAVVISFLMCMFALVAHWLACIWYVIGKEEAQNTEHASAGWLHELAHDLDIRYVNQTSTFTKYVTSMYYTLSTITSVGFGNVSANTNSEKIFTIVIMLIGALMHAVIFGNVTAIIQRMYSRRALYQAKERDLKDFVRSHNIPKPLKQRIMEYFMTSWSMTNGIDTHDMLRDFPEELRADICMHLHKEILTLPIFELAGAGCLRSLSLHIKTSFCAPGEYLIHRGDPLNAIWFLITGSMEVRRDGMVVAILGKGDLFGCDLSSDVDQVIQSNGDVHALTYCDLQSLTRSSLLEVLTNYPEYAGKFAQEIAHDLTYNLREGSEIEAEDEEKPTRLYRKRQMLKPARRLPRTESDHNGIPVHLPSISEDEEYDEEDDDDGDADDDEDNDEDSLKSPDLEKKKKVVTRLEIPKSSVSSFPVGGGDLSPRFVDGVEDDNNQYKNRTFDFPATKITSSRNRSPVLNRRARLMNNYHDSNMRTSFTSPQLYQGVKSDSNESLSATDLKHEVEYTRTSVERLDKQVSNLSQDVASLSQDLRSVIRLLQMSTSPPVGASASDTASNVPNPANKPRNNSTNRPSALQETSFPIRSGSNLKATSEKPGTVQATGCGPSKPLPPQIPQAPAIWQKRDAFVTPNIPSRQEVHLPLKPVKSTNLDEKLDSPPEECKLLQIDSIEYDSDCSGTDL